MKTVVVVPTVNEATNIVLIARQITRILPGVPLLVMDDSSPDGTADVAEKLFNTGAEYAGSRVIRRTGPRGLGRAYRDGFERALAEGYDRVIQMDADLSHDPQYLPAMIEASAEADLVIGSRYCVGGGVRNWPRHRQMISRFAVWYVQHVAGIPVFDATAGYRCWTRHALEAVQLSTLASEGYSFQVEMTYRACQAGMKIVEMPIIFTDRRFGRSKISRAVLVESCLMPWRLRIQPWHPQKISPCPGYQPRPAGRGETR